MIFSSMFPFVIVTQCGGCDMSMQEKHDAKPLRGFLDRQESVVHQSETDANLSHFMK